MDAYLARSSTNERSAVSPPRPILSSLRAFLAAAVRPPSALARAIVIVLAVKLVAVATMAVYFHYAKQHVAANAAVVDRLLGPASLP